MRVTLHAASHRLSIVTRGRHFEAPESRATVPNGLSMNLYHATDDAGIDGIRQHGFGQSHLVDSPDASWLSSSRERAVSTTSRTGWIVIVDVPEAIAEQHRYRFKDGEPYLDNYLVPSAVLNEYRPFQFERVVTA
jgi:hypothetical protein